MDPAEAPEVASRRPEYIREGVLDSALACQGVCVLRVVHACVFSVGLLQRCKIERIENTEKRRI